MTTPLEVICANKIRVEKKAIVETNEQKCKSCSGYNDNCEKYYPMVVGNQEYRK